MPLGRSSDYRPNSGGVEMTEEERKAQEKARRKFALALEDMADEGDAVLITVLKDLGVKDFGNGSAQGYLIRLISLTGDHEGLVNDDYPIYKRGFVNRIERAGVGASFVARLGRYGDRKAIGLEDDEDGDYALAEAALAKHGDPFQDAAPGKLAAEVDAAKRSVKEKVAAGKVAAGSDDEPPF